MGLVFLSLPIHGIQLMIVVLTIPFCCLILPVNLWCSKNRTRWLDWFCGFGTFTLWCTACSESILFSRCAINTPLPKNQKQQLQSELYLAAQKKKLDSMFNINHVLLLCMYKCHHVVIQLLLTFLLLGYGKVHMFWSSLCWCLYCWDLSVDVCIAGMFKYQEKRPGRMCSWDWRFVICAKQSIETNKWLTTTILQDYMKHLRFLHWRNWLCLKQSPCYK